MALIPCFNCDKTYLDNDPECPYCGFKNVFCGDDDLMVAAVIMLAQKVEWERSHPIEKMRWEQNIQPAPAPPKPQSKGGMRWWEALLALVTALVGLWFLLSRK